MRTFCKNRIKYFISKIKNDSLLLHNELIVEETVFFEIEALYLEL